MSTISIDVDETKLAAVRDMTGARNDREAVDQALDLVIQSLGFTAERTTAIIRESQTHRATIIDLGDR